MRFFRNTVAAAFEQGSGSFVIGQTVEAIAKIQGEFEGARKVASDQVLDHRSQGRNFPLVLRHVKQVAQPQQAFQEIGDQGLVAFRFAFPGTLPENLADQPVHANQTDGTVGVERGISRRGEEPPAGETAHRPVPRVGITRLGRAGQRRGLDREQVFYPRKHHAIRRQQGCPLQCSGLDGIQAAEHGQDDSRQLLPAVADGGCNPIRCLCCYGVGRCHPFFAQACEKILEPDLARVDSEENRSRFDGQRETAKIHCDGVGDRLVLRIRKPTAGLVGADEIHGVPHR